ncbi:MAG: PepSY domain-containing protein [Steroidobacteraceae bacterium]
MTATLPAGQDLYARLWRWHFFAALIVIPFVLWQSVTGVAYLWRKDLSALLYPQLMQVTPAPQSVSLDEQLASVLGRLPRNSLTAIEVHDDPSRSTTFFFRDDNGLPFPAFVNPHSGAFLGWVTSTYWLPGLSRGLHGGWPIEPYGSYLLELGASWAIVMILTGLYLWWPRQNGLAGALYPRLRAGSRVFWRDLHAVVGIYFALAFLAFLFTALPWTTFWGDEVLGRVQQATGQVSPNGFFFASGADPHHASDAHGGASTHTAHTQEQSISLDELIASARAAGARGTIELHPALQGGPVNVRDDHARAPDEVWLQLDAQTGAVLTRVTWRDFPLLSKLVSLGVDLHEGSYFGRANQVFNTLVALALVWLCVTGFIGWYRRRPAGGLAPPPHRAIRFPAVLIAAAGFLCVALPLLGASVLAITLLDRALGRLLPSRA